MKPMEDLIHQCERWNLDFEGKEPEQILQYFITRFGREIALASSLGLEDQVLTDMIMKIDPGIPIFTLDTGRLFPETYDLIQSTNSRYKIKMEIYFPEAGRVENMVREHGINLFYDSIELRKHCCHIRKIEPLKRAMQGRKAWISGLRRSQSVTRTQVPGVEWDSNHQMIKVNPLVNWSEEQVWEYIKREKVPFHPLHLKGYPSIGCQPCTRAIEEGEDIRAGRWWWENPETRECGLHIKE